MVTNLVVEWVGDELRASWQGGDDPTVFVSGSPDDAGTVIVPVETPGRIRVVGLPTGFRAYVHVLDLDGGWTTAGERLVRVGRACNAVDLGGAPAGDGRSVRWGRVFAGDPIDDLDGGGADVLRGLGIAMVCDLRRADSPGRPPWLDADVRWELPGLGEDDATQLAEVASFISDRSNQAVLFHAAVGRDRAVVVAALLLSVVGVADADLPFFPTRPEVLADLRGRYGTIERHLLAGAGPTQVNRAMLETALLDL